MLFRQSDRPRPSAAALSLAVRTVVERLEVRTLLSGAPPQLQSVQYEVQDNQVAFLADFADADAGDAHTATADWGDGSPPERLPLDEPGASADRDQPWAPPTACTPTPPPACGPSPSR